MSAPATPVEGSDVFAFGDNWREFLRVLDDDRVAEAERSLRHMLKLGDLRGKTFLDIGSGSGLFSLAARRLGARVHSFDRDAASVACTRELRQRYLGSDVDWTIEEGSVLDEAYLRRIGHFDIVYSWGVLHHTGDMWRALGNAERLVADGGLIFIAIYNDQGRESRNWGAAKRFYNRSSAIVRTLLHAAGFAVLWGPTMLRDLLHGKPFDTWRNYHAARGMHPWRDLVDWMGGYPFEVAQPEHVFRMFRDRGFSLVELVTAGGGHGCNELVFKREVSCRVESDGAAVEHGLP